ncbi:heterokaryon incompatibility protein-domain-containing protein [Xylariales sp. PMI_506]|nr:heterokaryon incompatibility protein-domain-containing protein [Xylariales sp. PMI_506]
MSVYLEALLCYHSLLLDDSEEHTHFVFTSVDLTRHLFLPPCATSIPQSAMICQSCERIFKPAGKLENRKKYPHHSSTVSFQKAVEVDGCYLCCALASEIDNLQETVFKPAVASKTRWYITGLRSDEPYLYLNWTDDKREHWRTLALVQSRDLRRFLPVEGKAIARSSLQTARTWVENCLHRHPRCASHAVWKTSGETFQPKRLVEIGGDDHHTWRVVLREEHSISPASYATLSHRWSSNATPQLDSTSIESFKRGAPFHILPQTFRDAISVARKLDVKYIWIDCLCILQDSTADWQLESLEMCKVYTHSICNISATGVPDNSFGFLAMLDDTLAPLPCVHPTWAPESKDGWRVVDPFFWWAEVTKTPLMKRGWVFQERFLAPRVLHFGARQMLWECATLDACETYPMGLPPETQSEGHTRFKSLKIVESARTCANMALSDGEKASTLDPAVPAYASEHPTDKIHLEQQLALTARDMSFVVQSEKPLKPGPLIGGHMQRLRQFVHQVVKHSNSGHSSSDIDTEILYFWCDTVQAYMRTNLSKSQDKLIALAGVAEMTFSLYQMVYGTKSPYLAGMFQQHLVMMLEWHCNDTRVTYPWAAGRRCAQFRAPSWSWASVDSRVYYEYLPRTLNNWNYLRFYPSWVLYIDTWNDLHIKDKQSLYFPAEYLGCRSLVSEVSVEVSPISGSSQFGQVSSGHISLAGLLLPTSSISTESPIITYLDTSAAAKQNYNEAHYLPLRCIVSRAKSTPRLIAGAKLLYWVTGLVLERVNGTEDVYQRIGLFCIPSSNTVRELGIETSRNVEQIRIGKGRKLSTIKII